MPVGGALPWYGEQEFALTVSLDAIWSLPNGVLTPPYLADPSIIGKSLYAQAIVADPGANAAGLIVSDAGEIVIGAR